MKVCVRCVDLTSDPDLSRMSKSGGSTAEFVQSLDAVRTVLGMEREEDVATGKAKKSLRNNKQFRNPVILRRIITALNSFSLFSTESLAESNGAVLDHRLDSIPDAVHIANRLVEQHPKWEITKDDRVLNYDSLALVCICNS